VSFHFLNNVQDQFHFYKNTPKATHHTSLNSVKWNYF
jgi:hypothetical protein